MTAPTIDERLAVHTAAADRVTRARISVAETERALEAARDELRAARQARPPRDGVRLLSEMKDRAAEGARVIAVRFLRYPDENKTIPGVVVHVTAARVKVLTEHGEMVFDRKARAHEPPGAGRGDHRGYRIDVEELGG